MVLLQLGDVVQDVPELIGARSPGKKEWLKNSKLYVRKGDPNAARVIEEEYGQQVPDPDPDDEDEGGN